MGERREEGSEKRKRREEEVMKRKVKGKRKGEEIGNSARFVWKFIGFIGNRLEWKTE